VRVVLVAMAPGELEATTPQPVSGRRRASAAQRMGVDPEVDLGLLETVLGRTLRVWEEIRALGEPAVLEVMRGL
jgi:hypothetical protein